MAKTVWLSLLFYKATIHQMLEMKNQLCHPQKKKESMTTERRIMRVKYDSRKREQNQRYEM